MVGTIGLALRSIAVARTQTNLAWDILLDLTPWRGPMHVRLTCSLRAAIRAGRLPRSAALPPSRSLAADLGMSRSTVTQAYGQLIAEGYLEARTGSATRVHWAPGPDAPVPGQSASVPVPARFDLTPGRPDLRAFPVHRWVAAIRSAAASTPFDQLGYPAPEGADRLRQVLAEYLGRVRGAAASSASTTICTRGADAMMRACRALRAEGITRLAVEEPCWPLLREAAMAAGLEPVPVTVDDNGLVVDALCARPDIRAVCVSATHQFPTGVVMSPQRRAALLEWARGSGGVIIEDDYDAEFRYDRPAVATLHGMAPDRVFLLGSVSKTLAPAVGIGWVVTPARFVQAVRAASPFALVPPVLDQLALASFIESGAYDRHLRAARLRYRARRRDLLRALASQLPGCPVEGAAAGLHLLVRLTADTPASLITRAAARRGLLVADLDRFRMKPDPQRPALVLGYGNLPDAAAAQAVSILAETIAAAATLTRTAGIICA